MFKKRLIIDVQSATSAGLQNALKAAIHQLDKVVRPNRVTKGSNPQLNSTECRFPDGSSYRYHEEREAKPAKLRDAVQMYDLSHISDLAQLDPEDVALFAAQLPTLVASLKLAKKACEAEGTDLQTVMPVLVFAAEEGDYVRFTENGRQQTFEGAALQAAALRTTVETA